MHEVTKKFVEALATLHTDRDPGPIAELFADDATLSKAGVPHDRHGKDGARTFWQQYRDLFDDIEATFRHTVTDDGTAFLEWTSRGHLSNGADVSYDGVSVLDSADGGETITAFRTYYDTAAFLLR